MLSRLLQKCETNEMTKGADLDGRLCHEVRCEVIYQQQAARSVN